MNTLLFSPLEDLVIHWKMIFKNTYETSGSKLCENQFVWFNLDSKC